ncbi:hypothetical protein [Bradyrhizobium sacchari]|uniref:Uncharacterized protein n=1 Tax=Bradyrhizobium sacchari TaxID=1399419 RepID=A0A560KL00_9BRAD|nr:hypothetical protein [Bradyrhizobium sacchari]TWB66650.1 hypothetical protein FBZ94_101326 [Bradyrhizobium sacchari]TWB83886.1 hypothetical protein FBZ95_101325 [Bradyrhizobium sacchari]
MAEKGKPSGSWRPQCEADHYIRCPICGELLDMRDLGEVLDHLHGQEIEEEPMQPCTICDDTGWVCENHPDRPWDGPRGCTCGGAGVPCPAWVLQMERCRACPKASVSRSTRTAGVNNGSKPFLKH